MNPTIEKIPSEKNSPGAPYVAANFAPLKSEVTAVDLDVIGHVPEELTGRFLRIGPNPIDNLDQVRRRTITGSRARAWRTACGCAAARRNGSAAASYLIGTPPGS